MTSPKFWHRSCCDRDDSVSQHVARICKSVLWKSQVEEDVTTNRDRNDRHAISGRAATVWKSSDRKIVKRKIDSVYGSIYLPSGCLF